MQSRNLQRRDRITVERDGERIEVFNWVNFQRHVIVRGGNPVVDAESGAIGAGDSRMNPDAVTHWVAEELRDEFYIDVEDQGIEVIDPTSDEVTVL